MKKKYIDINEYAGVITKELERGVFLTTKYGDKVNSMVIGWGHIGRIWELPVFVAYARKNRFTREMLDSDPEFTVNVPVNGFDKKAFSICGTKSGRKTDKIKEAVLQRTPDPGAAHHDEQRPGHDVPGAYQRLSANAEPFRRSDRGFCQRQHAAAQGLR